MIERFPGLNPRLSVYVRSGGNAHVLRGEFGAIVL